MQSHDNPVCSGPQAFVPQESIERIGATPEYPIIEVHRVVPCHNCLAPICVIEFANCPDLQVSDAVPDASWKHWTVDLLAATHECQVTSIWDSDTLARALERTRRHCCGVAGSVYVDVRFAFPCGQCGELIAAVRLDGASVEFYNAIELTCPPEMWRDYHATPTEYIANLAQSHRCSKSGKGIRQ
jgi:hypothetical protein